jgi:tight adherence protein B
VSGSLARLDAIGSGRSNAGASAADRVAAALRAWARRRGFARARELLHTRTAVVDLCRALAAELRAGRASAEAFAAAVQAGPIQLSAVLQSAVAVGRRGDTGDLADAVAGVAATPGYDGLRAVVACWRVAAASGAALAPAIDRVADALQDEIDLGREVTSIMAGPRATVHVLAGLPVIGLLLGTAIGARPIDFLFGSVPGVGCVLGAVALDGLGVAWARRIARRAARLG